jgi:PAS domain S-box-containing protein
MKMLKILCIEDSVADADILERELRLSGLQFSIEFVDGRASFLHALENNVPDIVISDHTLHDFNSLEALEYLKEKNLDIPFILVTGTVSEEFAVEILKKGADDYILKSNYVRLPYAIKSALEKKSAEYEKKCSIEKLKASEKHYRQLFEANPLSMWIIDKTTFQFLDVNEAAVRHYGYAREEFLNMTALDLRPYTEKEKFLAYNKQIKPGLHNGGIWRHKKKDSSLILAEITVNEIEYQGKKALLILAVDITEKVEYTNRLEELLFITSHKIRQPVTQILGIANLLEQELVTESDLQKILAVYKTSAKSLDDFTRELTERLHEFKSRNN